MIRYFAEEVNISFFKERRLFSNFLKKILDENNYKPGDINYVFCNDEYLLSINKQYLNHDYYTDTISFSYNTETIINGDIFISIDRVKENSVIYKTGFKDEFYRVMIHGFLHLLGYEDKGLDEDTNEMIILQEKLLRRFLTTCVSRETF
ncbi:MAG: putative rRNA maturation factor [Bacteroidales bacterium]|jgi:rRNA maturation RNase YbeY|nr:putative rRNA maturation factor [Bacteroidales bacterium]MDN5328373.1 putative rRNA maturation factor [Bacteroidales bacterium]